MRHRPHVWIITIFLFLTGCGSPGPSRREIADAQNEHDAFTKLCSQSAHESIKRTALGVRKIYLSKSSDVIGAYGFELFFGVNRAQHWASAELLDGPVPDLQINTSGAYEVRYTHIPVTAMVGEKTLKFHGVRQEIIELSTKEVIAERENYIWGMDFNRSTICLSPGWFSGNNSFVDRIIGYRYRDEHLHTPIPEKYIKASILGSTPVTVELRDIPIQTALPPGAVSNYNDRKVILPDGGSFSMPSYFNGEPLPGITTLEDESSYIFVMLPNGHLRNWPLRQILLFRRDKSGKPLEKIYVQLPAFVDWSNGWGVRAEDFSLQNGTVRISVYGKKKRTKNFSDQENNGHYTMRYDFVAR